MTFDPGPWASWAQIAAVLGGVLIAIWRYDKNRRRADEKVEHRLDSQDAALKALTDGFTRQFGTNGFVLHEKVKAQSEALDVVRDGLADHIKQHVDRSFGR